MGRERRGGKNVCARHKPHTDRVTTRKLCVYRLG
jgi:hypothetical protein